MHTSPDTSITFTENLPLGKTENRYISPESIFIGTVQEAAAIFRTSSVAIAPIATIQKLYKAYQELMETKAIKESEESEPESETPKPEAPGTEAPELETPEPETINTSLNILGRFT
ncbi:MAG: hypothetical protein ACKPE3_18435 [Sphaerospermopsis kisseleviana]